MHDSTSNVVSVSPFRCRMWDLHDRLEQHVTEENCRSEIESFSQHGQLVPVLGRTLCADANHDVELIYGARRLFVARHLNRPLVVELRRFTDREAIIAMHIENRHRLDVSPYERALSYARWLRSGRFESQEDLARSLKVSASQVSRLLKLARLPSVLVGAFRSPLEICEAWALELVEALDDPYRRSFILQRARAFGKHAVRPSGTEVFRQLLGPVEQRARTIVRSRDEVVLGVGGNPLFRVRQQRGSVALVFPSSRISAASLARIRTAAANILETPEPMAVQSRPIGGHRDSTQPVA